MQPIPTARDYECCNLRHGETAGRRQNLQHRLCPDLIERPEKLHAPELTPGWHRTSTTFTTTWGFDVLLRLFWVRGFFLFSVCDLQSIGKVHGPTAALDVTSPQCVAAWLDRSVSSWRNLKLIVGSAERWNELVTQLLCSSRMRLLPGDCADAPPIQWSRPNRYTQEPGKNNTASANRAAWSPQTIKALLSREPQLTRPNPVFWLLVHLGGHVPRGDVHQGSPFSLRPHDGLIESKRNSCAAWFIAGFGPFLAMTASV